MNTLPNGSLRGEEADSPNAEVALSIIPEAESSQRGVSVRYVPSPGNAWYVIRASYGREHKAFDYIVNDGAFVYIAKRYAHRMVNGKKKKVQEILIPNLLFVYTTKEKAEEYIKNTPALSYLSYYYNHFVQDETRKNPPLTVSCKEMENFIIATSNKSEHLRYVDESQCHFKSGEKVKVTDGLFKGVEGRVARVSGQQRVVVSLSQVGLVATAYIPTAFLQIIEKHEVDSTSSRK